jgi:hypothetical protein
VRTVNWGGRDLKNTIKKNMVCKKEVAMVQCYKTQKFKMRTIGTSQADYQDLRL